MDQIFNIYLIFIALRQEREQKEMQRDNSVREGTDIKRMKEDVLRTSENCKRIKRNGSVSEDGARGQRKTDRLERMRGIKRQTEGGIKRNRCNQREQAVVAAAQRG